MFLYIGLQDRVEVLKLAIGNQANNKYLKNGWEKKGLLIKYAYM